MSSLQGTFTTFITVALLLFGGTGPRAHAQTLKYSEHFDSDPGWITDQPENYYWESGSGTFHATTMNDPGGNTTPTRYAYVPVNYDGHSMRLEFDIRFDNIDWSAGVMFGLFDQYLNLWPSAIAPEADSIFGSFGRGDGGMYIQLYVCESGAGCQIDQAVNVTNDNTWYHCTIEYSTETKEATLVLRDIASDAVVADLLIPGISGLKPELDYLGFARDPNGNDCCPSCSGYGCSYSATAHIDNVMLYESSDDALTPTPPRALAVGDADGNVHLLDLATGQVLRSTHVSDVPIAQLDVIDTDQNGTDEILVTHLNSPDSYTSCLNGTTLENMWTTDHTTSLGLGYRNYGDRIWSGDFDADGQLDLVIPLNYGQSGGALLQAFSAVDGTLECTLPQTDNWLPIVYQDPVDMSYRLIAQRAPDGFTHYLRNYDLNTCGEGDFEWENTSVNTWLRGAVGQSLIDGLPRVWGGWYGRTLYIVDGNGNNVCSRSYGGSYEAAAVYAGDLRGDGVEALLVGGTYGNNHVRLDAVSLDDCSVLWTFDDLTADWAIHALAAKDINGDGIKEVIAGSGSENQDGGTHPKFQVLHGDTGQRIWERIYPFGTQLVMHAELVDVDGDGDEDVLLISDNSVTAWDILTGDLIHTYTFAANVDSIAMVTLAPDLQYKCVVRAAPSSDDQSVLLPTGIAHAGLLDPLVVEFWASDPGPVKTGVVSAYADLDFTSELLECGNVEGTSLFNLFSAGTCSESTVDEWGGSQLNADIGVEPTWARVATAEFVPVDTGPAEFRLQPADTESSAFGRGLVPIANIGYGSCSVDIVCPCSYDLDDNCNIAAGDLGLFAPCWSLCEGDPDWGTNDCGRKDFDCSGCVSGGDLGWFAGSWQRSCGEIDPTSDYPACRKCDPPVYCSDGPATIAGTATEHPVLLSVNDTTQNSPVLLSFRTSPFRVLHSGDIVRVEVVAADMFANSEGLTAVYMDVHYDPDQLEVVSVGSGDTYTVLSHPVVGNDTGTVVGLGGATMEPDHGVGNWTVVGVLEFRARVDTASPEISVEPSAGEAVSRYRFGLVPRAQIQVLQGPGKPGNLNRAARR